MSGKDVCQMNHCKDIVHCVREEILALKGILDLNQWSWAGAWEVGVQRYIAMAKILAFVCKAPIINDLLAYRMKTYLAIPYFYSMIYFLL